MNIISALYGTQLFGRERENMECYKTFLRLGHKVQVFGSYREEHGGASGLALTSLGVKCGELPFGSHFSPSYFWKMKGYWWLQIKRIYWCSTQIRRKAREMEADAIFIGGTMEFLYLWPFLMFQSRPIIYRVGDAPIWSSRFQKHVMKTLLRNADLIVPCSHFIHSECARLLPQSVNRSCVIWNIPPTFSTVEIPKASKDQTNTQLRLVYVGQIAEAKGIRTLIQALMDLAEHPNWECKLIGGSTFTAEFEEEMKSWVNSSPVAAQIEFVGMVQDPTPYYEWANWHVLPSHLNEAFGLVIVEAKRAGLPSIVMPNGAMPELIEDEVDGLIADSNSVSDLKVCIIKALTTKLDLGTNARQSYLKQFNEDRFDSDWRNALSTIS